MNDRYGSRSRQNMLNMCAKPIYNCMSLASGDKNTQYIAYTCYTQHTNDMTYEANWRNIIYCLGTFSKAKSMLILCSVQFCQYLIWLIKYCLNLSPVICLAPARASNPFIFGEYVLSICIGYS